MMGVLTGRPINFWRLFVFGLVLFHTGKGPQCSVSAAECVYKERNSNRLTVQECEDKGCLHATGAFIVKGCAYSPEKMKCLREKGVAAGMTFRGNCLSGTLDEMNYANKGCHAEGIISRESSSEARQGYVHLQHCHCHGYLCNDENQCDCTGTGWGVTTTTTTTPATTQEPDGGKHGHASTLSTDGVVAVTLGVLMIFYAWKGS